VPSEPPSRLVAAPPEKPEIAEAMPAEWRATCCWPELEEPAQPPAWPLALLPLGLYPLWWIAKPTRGLRAVRGGDARRVAARSRLHRHNGRDSIRERREVSAIGVVRERRSATRGDEQLSSRRRRSTGLDESATSLFVLPINEQQHVSLASLVDAARELCRSSSRGLHGICNRRSQPALRPLLRVPSTLSELCVHCLQVPRLHDHLLADQVDQAR